MGIKIPYSSEYGKVYRCDASKLMRHLFDRDVFFSLQIHDIPYNVSVKNADIKFKDREDMTRSFGDWDYIPVDLSEFAKNLSIVAADDANVIVFFNNWRESSELFIELEKYFDQVTSLVWKKTNPRPQVRKRHFVSCHENLIWASRGKYIMNFSNHREMLSVKECPITISSKDRLRDGDNKVLHKTQKPVNLIQYYIETLSNKDDHVFDAYSGVSTTAVAAIRSGRKFVIGEKNKRYIRAGVKWIKQEIEKYEDT